jgi:hypothetical protein
MVQPLSRHHLHSRAKKVGAMFCNLGLLGLHTKHWKPKEESNSASQIYLSYLPFPQFLPLRNGDSRLHLGEQPTVQSCLLRWDVTGCGARVENASE